MDWLEWGGWDGIGGVVALIALAAALVVTFIELRAWYLSPRDVAVETTVSRDIDIPGSGVQHLTFRFRISGPQVLHEVRVIRNGGGYGAETLDERAVLEARDGYLKVLTELPDPADPCYFITTWREATRLGWSVAGVRIAWGDPTAGLQRWRRYRWPFWPRRNAGRWVREQSKGLRGLRGMYIPPGYDH